MLGEFEYFVLAAAARFGEQAYGVSIRKEIERILGRDCSIGALYTTLERLEVKGLIRTHMGEATSERGGRAKKMVRLTAKGRRAGAEFETAVRRMSTGLVWEAGA